MPNCTLSQLRSFWGGVHYCNSLGSPHLTFSFSILQFSSQSKSPDSSQELHQALEERTQLEAHVGEVRPCREQGVWKDGPRCLEAG